MAIRCDRTSVPRTGGADYLGPSAYAHSGVPSKVREAVAWEALHAPRISDWPSLGAMAALAVGRPRG